MVPHWSCSLDASFSYIGWSPRWGYISHVSSWPSQEEVGSWESVTGLRLGPGQTIARSLVRCKETEGILFICHPLLAGHQLQQTYSAPAGRSLVTNQTESCVTPHSFREVLAGSCLSSHSWPYPGLSQSKSWRSALLPSLPPAELCILLLTPPTKSDTYSRCSRVRLLSLHQLISLFLGFVCPIPESLAG